MTFERLTRIAAASALVLLLSTACATAPVEKMRPIASEQDLDPYGEPGDDLVRRYYTVMNQEIERINAEYHAQYERLFKTDAALGATFSIVGIVGEGTAALLPAIDNQNQSLAEASRVTALATGLTVSLYFGVRTILKSSNIGYESALNRFSVRQAALFDIRNYFQTAIVAGLRSVDPDTYEETLEVLRSINAALQNDSYHEPGQLVF